MAVRRGLQGGTGGLGRAVFGEVNTAGESSFLPRMLSDGVT